MKISDGVLGKQFEWEDQYGSYELQIRNVGDKNPKQALQICFTKYPKFGKRRKFVSFSIPQDSIKDIMKAIERIV